MTNDRIALVTGANQGMGKHVAKELVSDGTTVFVGSRDLGRGQQAAAEIGEGAIALQLDVTDAASVAAAAERIRDHAGRLDVLVNNAAISSTRTDLDVAALRSASAASVVPLEEIRAVWDVNAFGPLRVYQAMLPLLRASSDARIVNVTSELGSLTAAAEPASFYHSAFEIVYAGSKTVLSAMSLAMQIETEGTDIKVNLVSPGFANTALVHFQGTDTVEDAAREIVRVARLGAEHPGGTFTRWNDVAIAW